MNYEIIKNPEELKAFIEWLPELTNKDKYYVALFARKKYNGTPGLKADKQQLKRFTSCKKRLYNKIAQLEVRKGLYMSGDLVINEESLALYISPNPRNMVRSTLLLKHELTLAELDGRVIDNINSLSMNIIQNSTRKGRIDWDLDLTPSGLELDRDFIFNKIKMDLSEIINIDAVAIIETHGGFHLLVDSKLVSNYFRKSWFINLSNLNSDYFKISKNKSELIPVPGCIQGNRSPKMRTV